MPKNEDDESLFERGRRWGIIEGVFYCGVAVMLAALLMEIAN